jgi:hypothetical protein
MEIKKEKRKPGIPTGNAGEHLVMGELLRRGFDAQLAGRNTTGYDLLVGRMEQSKLRKVQVKSTRGRQSWYVNQGSFVGSSLNQMTVYVLLGSTECKKPVRFFMVRNRDVKKHVHIPSNKWRKNAFLPLKAVQQYEDRWASLVK